MTRRPAARLHPRRASSTALVLPNRPSIAGRLIHRTAEAYIRLKQICNTLTCFTTPSKTPQNPVNATLLSVPRTVRDRKTVSLLGTVPGPSYLTSTMSTESTSSRKGSLISLLHITCRTLLNPCILSPSSGSSSSPPLTAPEIRDTLVKTYFGDVHPFAPILNRIDFIRAHHSGTCSLFLLHTILTPATLRVPTEVLSACGFSDRSAAQESFFIKAKLLHNFAGEDVDPLVMLQGSIILSMVILDHPTDRDFGYWFHNAVRLATKLDLCKVCVSPSLLESRIYRGDP